MNDLERQAWASMKDVLQRFVERVEEGSVKSVYTYNAAREAIEMAELAEEELGIEYGETEWEPA